MHDLRRNARRLAPFQKTISQTGNWIGQSAIGERELIARVIMIFVLALIPTGLGERLIDEGLA